TSTSRVPTFLCCGRGRSLAWLSQLHSCCGSSLPKLEKASFLQMKAVLKPPAAVFKLDMQCRMQKY
ncbi:Hypothetical predicted protein, partial [Marmota monax]